MFISSRFAFSTCIIPLLAFGCITVRPQVVDTRTALENQILGEFEALSERVLLLASVRSTDGSGQEAALSPYEKELVRALLNREFNRDDVDAFRRDGCVGESSKGLLTFFETERTREDPKFRELVLKIVEEENQDRTVIMEMVLTRQPDLAREDMDVVRQAFYRLNLKNVREGDLVQGEDGKWDRKEE